MRTLKPKIKLLDTRSKTITSDRMTGRKLQSRRLRLWSKDPRCASCGRVTQYPNGFELDHKTPLFLGGQDTDENCQIMCIWYDGAGNKHGCHVEKSSEER
jgi:5-methylcytosine-specific restriction protein A